MAIALLVVMASIAAVIVIRIVTSATRLRTSPLRSQNSSDSSWVFSGLGTSDSSDCSDGGSSDGGGGGDCGGGDGGGGGGGD
jgi:uncharacterized membrane protein